HDNLEGFGSSSSADAIDASPATAMRLRPTSCYWQASTGVLVGARACGSKHALPVRERPAVETAKRIDNFIKADRMLRARGEPHSRLRFDRAGIGRPGGKDRT